MSMNRVIPAAVGYFPPELVVKEVRDGAVFKAVSWERAAGLGIETDIVFVREDGWTLGATAEHARAAFELWGSDYVFFAYVLRDLTPGPHLGWRIARVERLEEILAELGADEELRGVRP